MNFSEEKAVAFTGPYKRVWGHKNKHTHTHRYPLGIERVERKGGIQSNIMV